MSRQPVDYHGSSYEDLDRLIRSVVIKACRNYGLDVRQYGDDLAQEGWYIVLKKLPVYKDMGFKVTTWLFHFIRRDVNGAAQKIRRYGSMAIPVEDDYLSSFAEEPDPELTHDVDWESLDEFVLLHASGYTDKEISELTGELNVSRRRQRAHRELLETA